MSLNLYIPRKLFVGEEAYTEEALLAVANHIVVLAEPGGGKTELMESLAQRLGVSAITATVFGHVGSNKENQPLIIDAFDELAKIDQTGIFKVLANAKKANPTCVIISSRSSEWDNSATAAFKDFLGNAPLIVRLCDFDEAEQRAIFDHHVPNENFAKFQAEIARFDLEALLPNPQFLKLFADAYIQSERHFTDKRSIFSQAVERLAKEANVSATRTNPVLSTNQKINKSSEAFAKLLLSGAEGVCTSEANQDLTYPLLASLFSVGTAASGILATRLFKPGDSTDQHRPVHKIVAEYCAASYFTKRIAEPTDFLTHLNLLPLIAPNSIVRDELRGLLGWMASLGSKQIQESVIALDPYAVLANGDPSQLEHSSKRLLVKKLQEIEAVDPYFRKGDFWRTFSVAGFFTEDVTSEIRPLLNSESEGHLLDLILELLKGSPAANQLSDELEQLAHTSRRSENTRLLAGKCLLHLSSYDHSANLANLISEASPISLKIAAQTMQHLGLVSFEPAYIANFLKVCSHLYPNTQERAERTIGARYFLKRFISELELLSTEFILDYLTKDLLCQCGKDSYECNCRNGLSKVVGLLLDRHFELATHPLDSQRIWRWLENLNFHEPKTASQSKAVQILGQDHILRRSIISIAFKNLTDRDQIFDIKIHKFDLHSHSGLFFQKGDREFLINFAFESDNHILWASLIASHQIYRSKTDRGPDSLRRHMREQAGRKPAFMQEWANSNRVAEKRIRDQSLFRFKRTRRIKRREKRDDSIRIANLAYVRDNRELVESGRHRQCLIRFAELVLRHPDKIEHEFGDERLVRTALRNCLDFIAPEIPDLAKLAELQCTSQSLYSEMILYAACMEIMRSEGNLTRVDSRLLQALRTNLNMHYSSATNELREALRIEVDRLIFPAPAIADSFLREYVEPQLAYTGCSHPKIWLLKDDEIFKDSRATLSLEWLRRFPELPIESLDTIFEIAAQNGDHIDLKEIIAERWADVSNIEPEALNDEVETKRTFWLTRAIYFLDNDPKTYLRFFQANRDTIFSLSDRSGRMSHRKNASWPVLTSRKIEVILEAYISSWPKVYLPNHWGTGSPKSEDAYRFLTGVVWTIGEDDPNEAIPVLERLISDQRFTDMRMDLKSIHASQIRARTLRNFMPPSPDEVVDFLDNNAIVTTEGLRQLLVQELNNFQASINGGEFNSANRFYEKDERLDEISATEIIAERLSLTLQPQGVTITPEHQLKLAMRSDFTATKIIGGKRRLLVTEVKGQWHKDLYSAASTQLHERYAIHPDAEHQGIFLAIWFGKNEKVAGRKTHEINSARELRISIEATLPSELKGLIDVFVLDVSRPQ